MSKGKDISANEAWKALIEKYDIVQKISDEGVFHIKANQIKEYKEPRLMAKWDSNASLPKSLRDNKINILPDSRGTYVLGDFILYQDLPELDEKVTQMTHVDLPELESLDVNNITSEANAINVLVLSKILDDFLGTDENLATFNGRMGTGEFSFEVDTYRKVKREINVHNAQCEIDGGFENTESVVIMEAKNVVHEDFHVRQLYYPYRLWKQRVKKPIRLVFSVYSNMIFRLFEYRFKDINDYSSIELVKTKNYSLQDTTITLEDLQEVRKNVEIITDDNEENKADDAPPFIQANSLDRVISLLENIYHNPMTESQIAQLMDFEERQSSYYYNAGKYLGLFDKVRDDGQVLVVLTGRGERIVEMNYKKRQLSIVELVLQHQIFTDMFDYTVEHGEIADVRIIQERMKTLNVCGESLIVRRSSSVNGWLKWIFNLPNL